MRKHLASVIILLATSAATLGATDAQYFGTWNLNTAKSDFGAITVTCSRAGEEWTGTHDGTSYTFKMDGKAYPTPQARATEVWKQVDAHTWDVRTTLNRKVIGIAVSLSRARSAQQATPSSTPNTETQYVDVGGYKLRMQVAGSGTPTVVFDAGAGGSLDNWGLVFPEVARFTRVVAYDRAGLGKSELGPEPRSFTRYATELHNMLHRASISPPYVLVGHSLGAAYLRAFARLFQDEVAGLVFVDPFNEQVWRSLSAKEKDEIIAIGDGEAAERSPGQQAEWAMEKREIRNDFPELRSIGRPPDVPMMLLVAGRQIWPAGYWVKAVLAEYGTWITEASEGGLVFDPDSRHNMQYDNPALIISAIRRVVFPSALNALERIIKEKGVDAAIATYRQMKQRYPAELMREPVLSNLGYQQLGAKRAPDAIALFTLNVEMFPDRYTYESLAEAYVAQGDREAAISNYRKSLALNPDNTNAVSALKALGAIP